MRTTRLWRCVALGMFASFAFVAQTAAAETIAYAEESGSGGFHYVRLTFDGSPPQDIGPPLSIYFWAGSFVDDDFSKEYVIDYPSADLYSINTSSAELTLVGNVSIPGGSPRGMHWDPTNDTEFLIATDASCATSTLYTLDVSDASIVEVGSSLSCIAGLAIDAKGRAFGIDLVANTLVSIDTATGAATTVGSGLGFDINFAIGGFDFDPATGILYLFAYNADTGENGVYTVDTTTGIATLLAPNDVALVALAFAQAPDPIFANGFD
jgi:hypothetical protein